MTGLALTDGGIETSLIFHEGFDLPCFASFPLLLTAAGRTGLRRYFEPFLDLADKSGLPFVLDTATWRASPDWGERLGYTREQLGRVNHDAVRFATQLAAGRPQLTISGLLGPRGDGYVVGERMSEAAAEDYHGWQVGVLGEAGVDRITALTLTYPEEAVGVVRAASACGLPVVVSFTVETDGRLPSGEELSEAIAQVDAQTAGEAVFFMVNCAHPSHFAHRFVHGGSWLQRIGGLRANASALSHAELDDSDHLDEGDIAELAELHRVLRGVLPAVELLGGCCGTDHRHVRAISEAWTGDGHVPSGVR
jgi:S-methylmethionine-dependent homocysteine/selenocysteine methylase